ncbi:uncharacterized protein Triagg1_1561 [Trichoderma aggressivum f. europaeum]|uniref:ABM domain-containing protein n=1 Tax=Trichoderma aggressivum f. europaeum TaxID=173218 RepID=A0AAE1JH69_9HYPO|nr:hypothetical protein Triagg1_1561 [Trichoderma aggressivum f. europaeum]
MAPKTNIVGELVYTSLSVPPKQYQDVYRNTLEPILLARPGLILAMAGVVTTSTDKPSSTMVSLVNWESVDAHVAFIAGPAAKPFFEASTPLMSAAPTVEHYGINVLGTPAVECRYTRLLKATDESDKELLAKVHEKHVATEGAGMAAISNCAEDASLKTLILFSNSDKFDAAAGVSNDSTSIKSFTIKWYARGVKGE